MSLEQYKEATRKELWEILQVQVERITELENALRWSRDSNTGSEPSSSVMNKYYDDLIPKRASKQ